MASTHRAPKQWCLSKIETVNSFENWRQNLLYTLSLDKNFAPFLVDGVNWEKKLRNSPNRGFLDDGEDVAEANRRTRQQKVNMLELMLGQIANYCPVISRNTIVKNSTSIENIWQTIRLHYGFQSTGGHFIDFSCIRFEPDERPEDLYQRLMAFVEDNLLRRDSGITHNGEVIPEDEELTPTLENFIVLTWLRLVNHELPKLVKQRYGTELRSRTLASIKPEISQALESLLDEIKTSEDVKAMRATASMGFKPKSKFGYEDKTRFNNTRTMKSCPLCKEAGRPNTHFLSKCTFLPSSDRKYMVKARQIAGIFNDSDDDTEDTETSASHSVSTIVSRVQIRQSPYLDVFYSHFNARLTIDSGATGNMIRASTAKRMGVNITTSSQSAHQADGSSPLKVVGEVHIAFSLDGRDLHFEGLVVETLDVDILAGIPFMERNDIAVRPARRQVIIDQNIIYTYGSKQKSSDDHSVRRAHILRAPTETTTIWPGDFIEILLPSEMCACNDIFAIEPRTDLQRSETVTNSPSQVDPWPAPDLIASVSGKIRIPNLSSEPQILKRNEHFCQIRSTFVPEFENEVKELSTKPSSKSKSSAIKYSESVKLDPDDLLSSEMKSKFRQTLDTYDEVFNPNFSGYNGAVGPFQAKVNMGPVLPPQRKGRVPQYSRNQLVELQQKFDDLEQLGVFKRPEDVGISVEYLNPSFLVKKPNGGFRLVTAFADVGRYSKPQPSLMPDVDSTLRHIAQWKYLIATDLTKSFYQIPLSKESMKYCGVVTPFRGVRVYARSAMGMPGSETALEELMCRVLGDLVEEGVVCKIADDLYCGGDTPDELLHSWERLLQALQKCNLNLSASKTVIAPRQTTILGWIWHLGSIHASPHRVSALSVCPKPLNVLGLRSFIGAYKVLARVIPNCATLLGPLDDVVAGRDSKDIISWSDELIDSFSSAQKALSTNRSIVLPKPDDQLWIVTDGAVKKHGLGATLYVSRNDKIKLAGFFSAKLRKRQFTWLPCEIEALSIATAIKHFSPYIIQSKTNTCILTDSKPCVQAFEKLCRGEFSASPRVSTFLSIASRYQVSIRHVAGSSILPADFASRNAQECDDSTCQICTFVQNTEDSVVRQASVKDILDGTLKLPFTSRSAWLAIQSECSDLRRTHAHLKQGTRPSKRLTNIKDVKRYLNVTAIGKDGLLVVKRNDPLAPMRECIIVPRQVLDGFLTSLHIKLDHPSCHQFKTVIHRYFFALDMDKAIEGVSGNCHQCASLRKIPHVVKEQSTGDPPPTIGSIFAADVIKRERQLILVIREYVTSYTLALHIDNERHETLRDALLRLCVELRPLDGPFTIVRTDPAPGFSALVNDEMLSRNRIQIEIGRAKNVNKNPVAEKAIQEVQDEILRQDPGTRSVSPLALSLAVARLNSRIRNRGLSSREMWTQRDQFTNFQIPLSDQNLILQQHELRTANHAYSERSKAPTGTRSETQCLEIGDLVYLYNDRNKSSARDRYLVVSVEYPWCNIRKFTGNQFRSTSYRVKQCDCYKVPSQTKMIHNNYETFDNVAWSDDDETPQKVSSPPVPPEIPEVISEPPIQPNENDIVTNDTSETNVIQPDDSEIVDLTSKNSRPTREHRMPKFLKDNYVVY